MNSERHDCPLFVAGACQARVGSRDRLLACIRCPLMEIMEPSDEKPSELTAKPEEKLLTIDEKPEEEWVATATAASASKYD